MTLRERVARAIAEKLAFGVAQNGGQFSNAVFDSCANAAISLVLEEAAKVADREANNWIAHESEHSFVSANIATAIRALGEPHE